MGRTWKKDVFDYPSCTKARASIKGSDPSKGQKIVILIERKYEISDITGTKITAYIKEGIISKPTINYKLEEGDTSIKRCLHKALSDIVETLASLEGKHLLDADKVSYICAMGDYHSDSESRLDYTYFCRNGMMIYHITISFHNNLSKNHVLGEYNTLVSETPDSVIRNIIISILTATKELCHETS